MEACIARGGISHVLSQARASLKNPSRPFTPRTNDRPLFHGDDYRPGSRPSSSYSIAEQKAPATNAASKNDAKASAAPSGKALPPRPTPTAKEKRYAASASSTLRTDDLEAAEAHLKLMHALASPGQDSTTDSSDDEPSSRDPEKSTSSSLLSHDKGPMESSIELPSSDALAQTFRGIEKQIGNLAQLRVAQVQAKAFELLETALSGFCSSSGAYRRGDESKKSLRGSTPEDEKVSILRWRLFDSLVDLAVGPWQTVAKGVLSIAPYAFDLFEGQSQQKESDDADQAAKINALSKTLFVLSKDSQNDSDFCNVRYVESALALIAATNARKPSWCPFKTLTYVTGTLKNISSGDDKMLKLLATNGAIATLSQTLLWRSHDATETKEIAQFLVQATTILRNLSTSKTSLKQFNEAEVAPRLCEIVVPFIQHQELMVNVSRILGKLTLHEVPRSQINLNVEDHVGSLLKLVDPQCNPTLSFVVTGSYSPNQSETKSQDVLLVRIFFVLGNLCASNDRNRHFLGVQADAVPILLQYLGFYSEQYVRSRRQANDESGEEAKIRDCVDVLVKLVRLFANMAMNADVGGIVNSHSDELSVLLQVFDTAQAVGTTDEELMLNIVSCITNLSYYCSSSSLSTPKTFIEIHRLDIAAQLSQILWNTNEEAVLEAARAFGNLSRFKDVLRFMNDHKVLDGFAILLDHSNRDIVFTVCGVLMNAALDESSRTKLLSVRHSSDANAAPIDARVLLAGILECAALDDMEMSSIAAKVLYNLLLAHKGDTTHRYLQSEDGQSLKITVLSLVKTLKQDRGGYEDDSDDVTARRELQDVLSQLMRSMTVCD